VKGDSWKAGDDSARTAFGLWQVIPPVSFPWHPERDPDGNVVLHAPGDNVTVSLLEQKFDGVSPLAVDGDPAVGEVRVLQHTVMVSSELLGDSVRMTQLIRDMVEGKPIVLTRQAVEQRKDRAALARLRHSRLMVATFRRPDPAISQLVRFHRPVTHQLGKLEARPWCLICGSEEEYPCNLMHSVAEVIEHRID
jgi:hypothetical protein